MAFVSNKEGTVVFDPKYPVNERITVYRHKTYPLEKLIREQTLKVLKAEQSTLAHKKEYHFLLVAAQEWEALGALFLRKSATIDAAECTKKAERFYRLARECQ